MEFGLLTLLPPLLVIVLALWTRRTFEALLIGAVVGFIMAAGKGFLGETLGQMQNVLADNAWMFLVLGLFGSFNELLKRSRGTYAFGKMINRIARSEKQSLLAGWLLGIVIFIDDYLNIITLATSLRDNCDEHKTPREMLAYVIDSTGAPICVLIPISTWAVFYGSVIESEAGMASYGTGWEIYLQAIPYIFYGWIAILVVPLVIVGVIPKVFGMKKAYERVATTGRVYSIMSDKYNTGDTEYKKMLEDSEGGVRGTIWDFLVPLIVLVALTIYTEDLFVGMAVALAVMFLMYLPRKLMKFGDYSDALIGGFSKMIPMLFILLGAFLVKVSMDGIGLPQYVIDGVLPYMNADLFPAITFLVVASLSFVTGSNWGIPALTVPILIPLALSGGADPIIVFAAIVSGGTFGSHACFYSDATVLTSQSCSIENLEHAFTQFPYALLSAIIALILFLGAGFVF